MPKMPDGFNIDDMPKMPDGFNIDDMPKMPDGFNIDDMQDARRLQHRRHAEDADGFNIDDLPKMPDGFNITDLPMIPRGIDRYIPDHAALGNDPLGIRQLRVEGHPWTPPVRDDKGIDILAASGWSGCRAHRRCPRVHMRPTQESPSEFRPAQEL